VASVNETSPNCKSADQERRIDETDGLMFGSSLADVFSAPAYDCRVLGQEQKPEFAVTRLRSGPRELEKAPHYPADNAILICISLRLLDALNSFQNALTWPEAQQRIEALLKRGLQQATDFEKEWPAVLGTLLDSAAR